MERLFVLRSAQQLADAVAFLTRHWWPCARERKYLAVSVAVHQDKRTLAQNRRYFGAVLQQIADQVWIEGRGQYSVDVWHEYFKRRFIGVQELPGGGTTAMSSAALGVEAFAQFMTQVEACAALELGVVFD